MDRRGFGGVWDLVFGLGSPAVLGGWELSGFLFLGGLEFSAWGVLEESFLFVFFFFGPCVVFA